MRINKIIKDKIKIDYLFIQGALDIDSNYFINEINKGIKEKENENFKTNVKGLMTSWEYFNNNANFLKVILPLFDYLDSLKNIIPYCLHSAWGIKEGFSNYTHEHDHGHEPNYFSGIIYLNDHTQTLLFPEIKLKFKPILNSFLLFSSFLKHKTIRNTSNKEKYAISFNLTTSFNK